jgi:hypothetical protein
MQDDCKIHIKSQNEPAESCQGLQHFNLIAPQSNQEFIDRKNLEEKLAG